MSTTNPNAPLSGIISRKEQLDDETRKRCAVGACALAWASAHPSPPPSSSFEAWQKREAKAHPLYTRTSEAYGAVPEGEGKPLTKPLHAKPHSVLAPVSKDTERRTALVTSLRVRTHIG